MNCIIVLLLLSCCGGWGSNGCGISDNCGCNSNRECGCRNSRGHSCRRESEGRNNEGRGCEPVMPFRDHHERMSEDCGCGQPDDKNCDGPGMIPPPWQEYPQFPRRGGGETCDCES